MSHNDDTLHAIGEVADFAKYGDPIGAATAKLIASYWQSPAGIGSVLASFASGAPFDADALVTDIELTICEVVDDGVTDSTVDPSPRGGWTRSDLVELRALRFYAQRLDDDECEGGSS